MPTELLVLALGCILGFVHIFSAGQAKTKQYGAKWNAGARDGELPPPEPVVGRLMRAQSNYFETFPIVIAAILIVVVAQRTSEWTAIGAWLWLGSRILYLPLYAYGVPNLRSLIFLVSVVGILMVLWPAFFG